MLQYNEVRNMNSKSFNTRKWGTCSRRFNTLKWGRCTQKSSIQWRENHVLKKLQNKSLTLLYWSFLSTFISLQLIKFFEYIYVTSLYWSFLSTCMYLTKWSFFSTCTSLHCIEHFRNMFLNSLYWSFSSTFTSRNCNESFWLNTLYFTVLKLLEYMYITNLS